MKQKRIFLTKDEALLLCAFSDDDTIHTFRQSGFGFIGYDLQRQSGKAHGFNRGMKATLK